jgi:hypothetical protein
MGETLDARRRRRVDPLVRQGERDGREALRIVAELEQAAECDFDALVRRGPDVEALILGAFADGVRVE